MNAEIDGMDAQAEELTLQREQMEQRIDLLRQRAFERQ